MNRHDFDDNRRLFLMQAIAGGGALLRPLMSEKRLANSIECSDPVQVATRPLKVVCVGAHPDDPESGCGGTLARYVEAGHQVTIMYLTRGERGIQGKSLEGAAAIRTAEAEAACRIIGAQPVFAGQIDGETELSRARVEVISKLLAAKEPHVVFTHWPIDTHLDHQVTSILTIRAYLNAPRAFQLYFFEVDSGSQTLGFTPTDYVDITSTRARKKAALFAHRSQNGEEIYRRHHEVMETFRGRESGVVAAEAFICLGRDHRTGNLPGL